MKKEYVEQGGSVEEKEKVVVVTALQIQRTNKENIILQVGDAVVFDHILTMQGDISYDSLTGIIQLNASGIFYVQWNIMTMSSESGYVSFSLQTSQGNIIRSNSLSKFGEMSGSAIITAENAGVSLQLVNDTGVTSLGLLPVQANMVIYSVGNYF